MREVIYQAIKEALKKWSMPIQNWQVTMSYYIIKLDDRLSNHL